MRTTVKLISTAGTGHFYTTTKNPKTKTTKLVGRDGSPSRPLVGGFGRTRPTKRKYDPVARRHVVYREGKL